MIKLIYKSKLSNKDTSISLKNPVWVELPQLLMFIAYFFHFNLFEKHNYINAVNINVISFCYLVKLYLKLYSNREPLAWAAPTPELISHQ